MNILFISTQVEPPWGGGEELWSATALRALTDGHHVTCIVSERKELHPRLVELKSGGADLLFWPKCKAKPNLLTRVHRKLIGRKLNSSDWWHKAVPQDVDAICVSQGGTYCALNVPGLINWIVDQPAPYTIVCHSNRLHVRPPNEYREPLRQFFASAASSNFVAEDNLRSAERYLCTRFANSAVVQNPVNLDNTQPVPWPSTNETLYFAVIARLHTADKGQDLLLDAMSTTSWLHRGFCLNLYGTGEDEAYLQELVRFRGLEGKVRLVGFESDVRKIWASNHLLVLPSISEGTPISLIEAQLCGRPAIVTRVDGNPDWIVDGESGFIAEAPTVHHVGLSLERAWECRKHWREMGQTARARCLEKRAVDPVGHFLKIITLNSHS